MPTEEVDPADSRVVVASHPTRDRLTLAVGLMLLAPVCAEYLTGYDSSTGDPLVLAAGLLIFAPLYGAPALLVRELARRHGVRWPGVLALAGALGIVQAGVVDQSLFSTSYREISYWDELLLPTFVQPLGLGAYPAMVFLAGHVIWSYSVPIALVEAVRPTYAERPWLRGRGVAVVVLLYLSACSLVMVDHLENERDHASAAQVGGSLLAAALLVVLALTVGRRTRARRDARVPHPAALATMCLVAAVGFNLLPETWLGVAARLALLLAAACWLTRLARSTRWTAMHVVAVAAGALLARAAIAFLIVPIGTVAPAAKYAHNVAFLLGAAALAGWAAHTSRRSAERMGESAGRTAET